MYQNLTPQEAYLDSHYHVYLDENNFCDFLYYKLNSPLLQQISNKKNYLYAII